MRLEVSLTPFSSVYYLPYNYNYQLSSAIYNIYRNASPEFSAWLHDKGWRDDTGKPLKLFNFSKLFFDTVQAEQSLLKCGGMAKFIFSSPIDNSIIMHFVSGMMEQNTFNIELSNLIAKFKIKDIKILKEPTFANGEQNFIMLNPMVASRSEINNGLHREHYIRPNEPELFDAVKHNLMRKYSIIHGESYDGDFYFRLDEEYIRRKGGADKISKLVSLRENSKSETRVKAFMCPLKIKAMPKMISVAYNCGIGQKNSMGFGMLETK